MQTTYATPANIANELGFDLKKTEKGWMHPAKPSLSTFPSLDSAYADLEKIAETRAIMFLERCSPMTARRIISHIAEMRDLRPA